MRPLLLPWWYDFHKHDFCGEFCTLKDEVDMQCWGEVGGEFGSYPGTVSLKCCKYIPRTMPQPGPGSPQIPLTPSGHSQVRKAGWKVADSLTCPGQKDPRPSPKPLGIKKPLGTRLPGATSGARAPFLFNHAFPNFCRVCCTAEVQKTCNVDEG